MRLIQNRRIFSNIKSFRWSSSFPDTPSMENDKNSFFFNPDGTVMFWKQFKNQFYPLELKSEYIFQFMWLFHFDKLLKKVIEIGDLNKH